MVSVEVMSYHNKTCHAFLGRCHRPPMKTNLLTLAAAATRDGRTHRQRGHTGLIPLKSMRNRYAILIIFAAVAGYFLLASFALSEPLPNRIAEDPTTRGKGKDGECLDYAIAVSSKDNENPEPKKVRSEASPMQLVFLLSGDLSAPVYVELQNGLNHLSFF